MRTKLWLLIVPLMAGACARGGGESADASDYTEPSAPVRVDDASIEGDEMVAVDFSFAAPADAETVHLTGDFANWVADAIPMNDDDGDGVWTVTEPITLGPHAYKFVVNGTDWYPDPENPDYEDDLQGGYNSLVNVQ